MIHRLHKARLVGVREYWSASTRVRKQDDMADKTPKKENDKKVGKTLKEKRAVKEAKRSEKSSPGLLK